MYRQLSTWLAMAGLGFLSGCCCFDRCHPCRHLGRTTPIVPTISSSLPIAPMSPIGPGPSLGMDCPCKTTAVPFGNGGALFSNGAGMTGPLLGAPVPNLGPTLQPVPPAVNTGPYGMQTLPPPLAQPMRPIPSGPNGNGGTGAGEATPTPAPPQLMHLRHY